MARISDWVISHRLWVLAAWALLAVAGAATASTTVDRLSYEFALPGQPAYETNQDIVREVGTGGLNDPLLVVVSGSDAQAEAVAVASQLTQEVTGTSVVTAEDAGAQALTSTDGTTSAVLVYPRVIPGADPYAVAQPQVERVVAEADRAGPGQVRLTGFTELTEGGGGDRSILVEVLLGAVGALVVLVLVFGSLLAVVPLLVAAVSILGTYLALLALTGVTDVSFVVQYLVALIGLGVAIDYSLLIVTRWREERDAGATDDDEAIRLAMATAGRSVVFSGVTVAVSLAALVLVPVPFLRSIGLGGLLIPLFSVATATTLVPALLSLAGRRLLWPRRRPARARSRGWAAVARGVVRNRWVTIAFCVVVLGLLALPVRSLALGSPQLSGLTTSSAGAAAADAVSAGVPVGVLRPTQVMVPAPDADTLSQRLAAVDGVAAVAAPTSAGWAAGSERLLLVWDAADPASDAGKATLDRVRAAADDVGARVGGSAAEDADFVTAVYGDVVWVVLGVAVVTFLLLAKALRSLWLPIKALVLNALSIAAAYGVTVLIWQEGHGSSLLFAQPASGAVTTWVPIAAFSFLFGLSMDYEVFILARMREAHDGGADTPEAVVDGIAHTGRLVTSAALILFLAFIALATVPSTDVKILATTLALGIVLDAVVVRSLLAPALVAVLGHANWTLPRGLARVLRVRAAE